MSKSLELINSYQTDLEQEIEDIKMINKAESVFGDILTRNNQVCHLCSSAFVVNKERTKVLCVYHNIYKSWSWIGGHVDGDDDLKFVAEKELREETSLESFKFVSDDPIAIDVLPVISHTKKGKFISSHLHFCVTFLVEADERLSVDFLEDESSGIGWMEFEKFLNSCTEPHMLPVYKKCIYKAKTMKNQ